MPLSHKLTADRPGRAALRTGAKPSMSKAVQIESDGCSTALAGSLILFGKVATFEVGERDGLASRSRRGKRCRRKPRLPPTGADKETGRRANSARRPFLPSNLIFDSAPASRGARDGRGV